MALFNSLVIKARRCWFYQESEFLSLKQGVFFIFPPPFPNAVLPLSPLEAPHLTIPNDPRPSVYRVSASNTTQEVTSGQIGIPTATNFLFRVLRTGTRSAVSYYWLVRESV